MLAVLGFTLTHSLGRARGSLPFVWLFAVLLAVATGVTLLPVVIVVMPPELPSGLLFLPSAALGVATAVLATLAARSERRAQAAG